MAVIDHDALLAAVCHSPADDAPRLVMADWFDENGQPERGEFVRVQVELARLGASGVRLDHSPHRGKMAALRRRELELWPGLWSQFQRESGLESVSIAGLEGSRASNGIVRRGFVDECRLTTAAFLAGGGCGRCRGQGLLGTMTSDGMEYRRCPDCPPESEHRGTGHTTGLAAVLGQAGPLTRITLTDREPHHIDDDDRWHGLWMWQGHTADGRRYPFRVDWGLFRRMKADEHHVYHGVVHPGECENIYYPTRDLAVSSLSTACLALLRR